ncbi:MAG TPA: D-alanyl-D-alanine carboxypeptidase, partial [Thermoanaerobaculia bacterium]|nr:D-alanyl-D-alanine carboxypeptidase [Thermoanaerobaculia bacterium]
MKWLLVFVCVTANAQTIEQAVRAAQATPPFDHALLMIDVADDAGSTLYAQNAHTLMIPASTRKLFSSATVQQCLGNDTRLPTELWLDGNDVVIKGGGDPSFGSERYETGFTPFVDALRRRGIVRVNDIIADVSLFDRTTIPYSWKVGNLMSTDAAPVDAITYNDNAIGDEAVSSAGFAAALAFRDALEFAGIRVDGSARLQTEPRTYMEKLAEVDSPYVEELLATLLKVSDNLYAETLYKRVSAGGDKPASYQASRDIEAQFLTTEVGVDPSEFRFVDGCGLAPDDLVTPAAIVKLLRWMNAPERRAMWWAVLAQPGSEGTLHRRLVELSDRMRGKTGTVNGVNSLAGIVRGSSGQYRYFAIAWNHHLATSSAATGLIDS